ncbi:MAG: hypothetical protein A2133_11165 [Actinobacteria bacterium RBG_16_64_13]|nr:MAG: hypothetical protein A2133_11165 [Actinobacteria bacterium RBG_16_64_13]
MENFFSPLSDFFFAILRFLHENVGVGWSWAIVLLTVIVRVVLVPLTWRQIKSMRAMQALQPQVKLLQEKYKNDRQILNQKMMEFYRENNVSPFGSCLPLLLQMPVFLGLFYMLREQGQAIFWSKDALSWLVPPDVGSFSSVWHSSPIGWLWIPDITKFNIVLMFLYIASQFVASWQMSRKGAGQQKIIAYVMPVMIGIFMFVYKWPAGLFIYWFTSNLWTIGQQFAAEKIIPVPVAVVAPPVKEKTTPARSTGKTSARPPAKTSARPAGKSGGKSSGQKTGQQGKATGSKSQRQNRGDGGSKGSS